MKKLITGTAVAVAVAAGVALAPPAQAAQAGLTRDGGPANAYMLHVWLKIGRTELEQKGAMGPCLAAAGDHFNCDFTVPLVEQQHTKYPKANGYWGERYYLMQTPGTTVKVRSGTW